MLIHGTLPLPASLSPTSVILEKGGKVIRHKWGGESS